MPRKGSNWHGHYFGPGNRIDKQWRRSHRPVDSLDAAAEKHDLRYSRLQSKYGKLLPYLLPSEADARFVKDIKGEKGFKAAAARTFFKAKGLIPFKLSAPMPKRGRYMMPSGRPAKRQRKMPTAAGVVGHYRGPLNMAKAKKPTKYEKSGYSKKVEHFGTQSLANVAYIGATSLCHNDVGQCVGVALIRKLMKRHYGFEYTHPDQQINPKIATSLSNVAGTGPSKILFYVQTILPSPGTYYEPTVTVGWTYDIYDPATLTSRTLNHFGTEFLYNVLRSNTFGAARDASNQNQVRIHGYQFIELDYTVAAGDPTGVPLNRASTLYTLANQYMNVYSTVTLGIQNVTTADTTGTTGDDTEYLANRIDANPIRGKLFRFANLLPIVRNVRGAFGTLTTSNEYKLMSDQNEDGILKPDSAVTGDWVQVPRASMFSNCTGERSVYLPPGSIRDYKISFYFDGTLEKFIKGFGANAATQVPAAGLAPSAFEKDAFGTSFMFCLDKVMPTGGSNVSVNFQYNSSFGCYFGKRLGMLMQRGAVADTAATTLD